MTYSREKYRASIPRQIASLVATWDRKITDHDGTINVLSLLELLDQQNYRCAICEQADLWPGRELDHIRPRQYGGKHTLANVRFTCARCNRWRNKPHRRLWDDYRKAAVISPVQGKQPTAELAMRQPD